MSRRKLPPLVLPDPIEAAVFDLDGLLIDSERIYGAALDSVLRAMGFEPPDALHASMMGLPGSQCDAVLRETFGPAFSSSLFVERFLAFIEPHFATGAPLKPGAVELLDHLDRRGLPKAVATSSGSRAATSKLRGAGLLDRFDAVITSSDVERGKPHPDVFLEAAARLGATAARCVAFEDSHNGVRAAHGAGMATIMVPDLMEPTEEIAALCAAVARDLHEAARLLGFQMT